jgi:hypothetical protein
MTNDKEATIQQNIDTETKEEREGKERKYSQNYNKGTNEVDKG